MPRHPINSDGLPAEKLFFVGHRGLRERADRIAELRGFPSRGAFLRARVEQMIEAEEAELMNQEASQAS
jgi:hypothetical protein